MTDDMPEAAATVAREVLVVFAGITALTLIISRVGGDYVHVLVGALFLLTAVQLASRRPQGLRHFGIELGGVLGPADSDAPPGPIGAIRDLAGALLRALPSGLRETAVSLGLAALIFPPFTLAFYLWHGPTQPFGFEPPSELGSYLMSQLLVVALPEEALFRGYFQGRLDDLFSGRRRLLGASLSPGSLLGQAGLFAVIHFAVDLNPVRLAVFFPALLFGWLRAWRGGIGAAVVFHMLSNLLSDVLVRGWLL